MYFFFFFQAEDGIRDYKVTGVQTCALPISCVSGCAGSFTTAACWACTKNSRLPSPPSMADSIQPLTSSRSEEHTSELQSPCNLVCRLLLEKNNNDLPSSCQP